jgi:cytoskeletal protein RodZ
MPTAQGLIAATFERLQQGPNGRKPDSTMAKNAVPAATPAAPMSRLVSTTTIHANEPVTTTAAVSTDAVQMPQAAAAPPKPVTEPAPVATPAPVAPKKVQLAARDPAPPARPAQAAPKSGVLLVSGQGVTVRSGPSKASSALFALAGGQKVTITSNQKGWLQIVDAQGRTGWAYSTFLAKP